MFALPNIIIGVFLIPLSFYDSYFSQFFAYIVYVVPACYEILILLLFIVRKWEYFCSLRIIKIYTNVRAGLYYLYLALFFLGIYLMLKYDDNQEGFTSGEQDNPFELADIISTLSVLRFALFGIGKASGWFI